MNENDEVVEDKTTETHIMQPHFTEEGVVFRCDGCGTEDPDSGKCTQGGM